MNVDFFIGVLCVVYIEEAVDGAFDAALWVGWGEWDIEIQVHGFLVGFWDETSVFDGERQV